MRFGHVFGRLAGMPDLPPSPKSPISGWALTTNLIRQDENEDASANGKITSTKNLTTRNKWNRKHHVTYQYPFQKQVLLRIAIINAKLGRSSFL